MPIYSLKTAGFAKVVFCMTTLLAGCGLSDRNLKETLSEKDIIGTWKLTEQSLRLLTRDKFRPNPSHSYTITFRSDGTCTFASVKDNFNDGKYLVSEGTWQLEHDTMGGSTNRKRNALRMRLHPKPNYTDEFYSTLIGTTESSSNFGNITATRINGSLSSTAVAANNDRSIAPSPCGDPDLLLADCIHCLRLPTAAICSFGGAWLELVRLRLPLQRLDAAISRVSLLAA
jgi:hypothetical protein